MRLEVPHRLLRSPAGQPAQCPAPDKLGALHITTPRPLAHVEVGALDVTGDSEGPVQVIILPDGRADLRTQGNTCRAHMYTAEGLGNRRCTRYALPPPTMCKWATDGERGWGTRMLKLLSAQ